MRIVFESSYFLECPVYIYQNTKCMEHANCRGLKYLPSVKAERQGIRRNSGICPLSRAFLLFNSLHPEVFGSQSCIVDLQDELGVSNAGRNDLAK